MFRDSLAASVEPVPGIHALLDWAEANGVGCAVVTNAPRAERRSRCSPPPASPHRLPTLVIGEECARAEARPRPLPGRHGRARRHPLALGRLRGLAAPASAPPAAPAPTSSA